MSLEPSASRRRSERKLKSPKALMSIGPLIPLALTACVIAGAAFKGFTSLGTGQLIKSHHTETLTSREVWGGEEDDDDSSHAWSRTRSVRAGERDKCKRWFRRRALIEWEMKVLKLRLLYGCVSARVLRFRRRSLRSPN